MIWIGIHFSNIFKCCKPSVDVPAPPWLLPPPCLTFEVLNRMPVALERLVEREESGGPLPATEDESPLTTTVIVPPLWGNYRWNLNV